VQLWLAFAYVFIAFIAKGKKTPTKASRSRKKYIKNRYLIMFYFWQTLLEFYQPLP
jgi:hypothetical protein